MTDDPTIEPSDAERLKALDEKLKRIEARKTKESDTGGEAGSGLGMQVLAELIVGIFGGLGLGWWFDEYFKSAPLGMIVGVLLGLVSSIYLIVKRSDT